jgi:hypothetical protein
MSSYDAHLRLYVQLATSQQFRTKALEARDNADDSFTYDNVTFYMGDFGSAFIQQGVNDPVPTIINNGQLKLKRCTISAVYPQTHATAQPGTYDGARLGMGRVHASVEKTGAGTLKIEVAGAPLDKVITLFDRIVAGGVKPTA